MSPACRNLCASVGDRDPTDGCAPDKGDRCPSSCLMLVDMSASHAHRGGPIIVDAADLPESLRAQLQALESARSRKRDGDGDGDGEEEDDDDDDEDEDDPHW